MSRNQRSQPIQTAWSFCYLVKCISLNTRHDFIFSCKVRANTVKMRERVGVGFTPSWGPDSTFHLHSSAVAVRKWLPRWLWFEHCFCINGQQSRSICLRDLPLSSRRTSQARRWCLLLVLSRRTIRATEVIIRLRIIHTCYHCMRCWAFFLFCFLGWTS